MITVRLKGGLGNQMFQYALGRSLSVQNEDSLILDTSYYSPNAVPKRQYDLDIFNIKFDGVENKKNARNIFLRVQSVFFKKNGIEKSFDFDPTILNLEGDIYLDGYWQSEKYFKKYENVIREDFTLKNVRDILKEKINEIQSCNSVALHIRRGDYVGNSNHPVQDLEYYRDAIIEISKVTQIDKIFVFSDDIPWCKENIKSDYNVEFFIKEDYNTTDQEEMILMSKCKHFIIANSSFSWWGAWLSNNPNKIVVAPERWFFDKDKNTTDLLPIDWIKI